MEKSPGAIELLMRLVWQGAHFQNIICVHDLVIRQDSHTNNLHIDAAKY